MDEDLFRRYERYDRYLDQVLDILDLVPPQRPTGDERNDRHARRNWQLRSALIIMREARPPLPDAAFEPLVGAGVYEPDPSHTQRPIRPALAAFGRRRVQTRLLEYLRTGTSYEIGGAAQAWYASWIRVNGSDANDDPCTDLCQEFQETGLRAFIANADLWARYGLISILNLRVEENPAHLRTLVTEVLHIAHAHPDNTLVNRIRRGL